MRHCARRSAQRRRGANWGPATITTPILRESRQQSFNGLYAAPYDLEVSGFRRATAGISSCCACASRTIPTHGN